MRALPLALVAAAATSFLELLPEPSMVCDNSKCRLEGEEPCLREYAIDRDCSTFGDAYLVLDDALAACARTAATQSMKSIVWLPPCHQ